MMKYLAALTLTGVAVLGLGQNPAGSISIDVQHPGHPISPNFYGLMTEEINHAYDGGLYAELIRNRSFRDETDSAAHWTLTGAGSSMKLQGGETPSLKIDLGANGAELSNSGYWGVPVWPNTTYKVTVRARLVGGKSGATVAIKSADGSETLASAQISGLSSKWKTFQTTLRTGDAQTGLKNKFTISFSGSGGVELNYVSLFPPTFHNRPNGNRRDLMDLLGGLKPSFLRLPGGNYLEGDTIPTRFEWKDTLGNPIDRKGHQGPWGYRSSDGMGLLEFLEWCDDLKMEPLLAVYAGYSLRGDHVEPGKDLEPFVQDALDEIEYLIGDKSTHWGAQRIKDGHAKPFSLHYVEIGNEDWFDRSRTYDKRFAQFFDAIKAKYPKLQLISTAPVELRKPDVVDDHYYRTSRDMAADSGHYDHAPRSGPKIFVGEWASIEGSPTPTLNAALGDAAWLAGLERDSDLVVMESYAPLLVNVNRGASQWGTNLVGYDALNSFASPSYYIQSMYASYTGDVVLPTQTKVVVEEAPQEASHGKIGLGSWRTEVEYKDIQVTHDRSVLYQSHLNSGAEDWTSVHGAWNLDDGAYRQTTREEGTLAVAGNPVWQDYTLHVKAKKLSGDEGFLVDFHVQDDANLWRWNIGGWDNSRSRIQRVEDGATDELGTRSSATVETGRWYDVRIEVAGSHIKCYLDDKLINEALIRPRPPVDPIYVAASKKLKNGHVMAKIVNYSDRDLDIHVILNGVTRKSQASGWVLKGDRSDVNSVASPKKVAPMPVRVQTGPSFRHVFPARSVTVLDIPG